MAISWLLPGRITNYLFSFGNQGKPFFEDFTNYLLVILKPGRTHLLSKILWLVRLPWRAALSSRPSSLGLVVALELLQNLT